MVLANRTKFKIDNIGSNSSNLTVFKRSCSPSKITSKNKKVKGILKNSAQIMAQTKSEDFFDIDKQETNNASTPIQKLENKNSIVNTNADTQHVEVEEKKEKEKEKIKDPNPAALPEGFFDDPVMDAKVSECVKLPKMSN